MKLSDTTFLLDKLKIKIPESPVKEDIIRFLTESKSERLVELPFVFENLPKEKIKILDIGCRYSNLPIQLASLGNEVHGVDIYHYAKKHPNFKFKKGDIIKVKYPTRSFDMAISVSTIEHIGLNFYEEGVNNNGDRKAVEKAHQLLKNKGTFLMTAPFGVRADNKWYRVYDLKRIKALLRGFKISKIETYKLKNGHWIPAEIGAVERIDSSAEVHGVFCLKAIKT